MTNEKVMQLIREAYEKNLTILNLSNNQLTQLPLEIKKLKNLISLDLSYNQLTQLPPEIGELKKLGTLHLQNNQLTQLPSEIKELTKLIALYLSYNQLTQLPPEIGELKNLTTLHVSNNQLTQLPPEIGELKKLGTLHLQNNQLTQLPSEIAEIKYLTTLNLFVNPLTSPPPEIVSKGSGAIFTYLKQTKTTENNEAKLILVGEGKVGKTCLSKRLITGKFVEDDITEGINISEWITSSPDSGKSKIKLNIWDFGGQEIYHATHQFFLTKRSVYILVWNARKTKDYDSIYYWLHTIEAFGEDSPKILVMSRMNESDDDLNLKDLKHKFHIVDYLKIDCKDGKGIDRLKESISEAAWNLPLMKVKWVDSWFQVRKRLEEIRENVISYDKFCEICKSEGLDDENINTLDGYLTDLGVTLHFKDRIALRNIVILKSEWATGAFYKILSTKSVLHREGVLFNSELDQIWDTETYPPRIYPQLMELMNKFELAYELPDKKSYLIPELLSRSSPDDFTWDEKDDLCFYYCYEHFLPPGIITRFIVRMHQDIEKKENFMPLCWREGAVLKLQNSRVLVEMKPDKKQIEIRIKGDNKRGALGAICYHLDQINTSIKKINVSKQIPCNCSENCPQRYSYEDLLEAEKVNIKYVQCHKTYIERYISFLLDGYKKREERSRYVVRSGESGEIPKQVVQNFVFSSNHMTSLEANQIMKNKQETDVNINVILNLNIDLPQIQVDFDNLRKEIKDSNPVLDSDLDKIQDSLDELSTNSDPEKAAKPFNKLYRFLDKLGDPNSDYNKVITGTQKGIEYAQKVGRTYNKFAQWLAMPQVPDLLLAE